MSQAAHHPLSHTALKKDGCPAGGRAGGEGSKMRDYIDEINNLYPADIVNYYSPNYAEDLLKKLEE